jgi:hypothetical protein
MACLGRGCSLASSFAFRYCGNKLQLSPVKWAHDLFEGAVYLEKWKMHIAGWTRWAVHSRSAGFLDLRVACRLPDI